MRRRGQDLGHDHARSVRAERNRCGEQHAVGRVGCTNRTLRHVASPLLRKVRSKRNLERSWRVIQDNARASKSEDVRREIKMFQEDPTGKLELIYRQLLKGTFAFPPAKGVPLPKGGSKSKRDRNAIRPIVLASLEFRIVQRAILNVLLDVPALQPFVSNPYSFGGLRKAEGKASQPFPLPSLPSSTPLATTPGSSFVPTSPASSRRYRKRPSPASSPRPCATRHSWPCSTAPFTSSCPTWPACASKPLSFRSKTSASRRATPSLHCSATFPCTTLTAS
jgi:hypothetical protein